MILKLPYDSDTARPLVQGPPDIEQDMVTVFPPVAVPESKFLNPFCFKKSATFLVVLTIFFGSMLRTIQLN